MYPPTRRLPWFLRLRWWQDFFNPTAAKRVWCCELQTCLKPQLQELTWEYLFILERCHDFKKQMLKYVQYTYITYFLLDSGEVEFHKICFIFVCEQKGFLLRQIFIDQSWISKKSPAYRKWVLFAPYTLLPFYPVTLHVFLIIKSSQPWKQIWNI